MKSTGLCKDGLIRKTTATACFIWKDDYLVTLLVLEMKKQTERRGMLRVHRRF